MVDAITYLNPFTQIIRVDRLPKCNIFPSFKDGTYLSQLGYCPWGWGIKLITNTK